MAVYKVIQDVEAEDRLIGPLTLKALVYAAIAALLAYLEVRLLLGGGPAAVKLIIAIILLPPIVLFTVLSLPIGREQPTEVWLLSHIRFFLKPRSRVWDQTGMEQLVTITAPKKIERNLTKDLSQEEVNSRLKALALTLDSRGWAVKNVGVNLGASQAYLQAVQPSDRLVDPSDLVTDKPKVDIEDADDIFEQANPTAQKFTKLMDQADKNRKAEAARKLDEPEQPDEDVDFQFLDQLPNPASPKAPTRFVSHKVVKPAKHEVGSGKRHKPADAHRASMTAKQQADKLELSKSGNDLSVDSISRLANRKPPTEKSSPDEVVIPLR